MKLIKLDIQLFADGKIVIETEIDTKGVEKGVKNVENKVSDASKTIKGIITGLGITKVISSAMNVISNSIDDAVSRVDTLNNFPKMMENLGISSQDTSESVEVLSEKLTGLPTTLNDATLGVARFVSKNNDIKKSTQYYLAMNNAILSGGASMELQTAAMEQLTQMYAVGRVDSEAWRSVQTAIPGQLNMVAKAMGYTSAVLEGDLYNALKDGTVSMDDFMDAVVRLNNEGIDGFESFENQAKTTVGGVKTSVTNMKTSVTRGVSSIIDSLDKNLKKNGFGGISGVLSKIGETSEKVLKNISKQISKLDLKKVFNELKNLIPVVSTLTVSFIAFTSSLNFVNKILKIKNAFMGLKLAFATNPVGMVVAGVVALTAGMIALGKATEPAKTGQEELNESLKEYNSTMKELDVSKQEYIKNSVGELGYYQDLYNELKLLIDSNGKIKEGYEQRAKFIVNELNQALGIEIEMTDGIIKNYDTLEESISDVIAQKRANILLEAEEEKYNAAKDKAVQLEEDYAKALQLVNEAEKTKNDYLKDTANKYGISVDRLKELIATNNIFDKSLEINGNNLVDI